MPLYEYRCESCGARVEVLHKVADPPLSVCSTCGGRLERLISAPALQFKGAGWYVTDYAKKGKPAESSEGTSSAESPSAKDATAKDADTKPAAAEAKAPAPSAPVKKD